MFSMDAASEATFSPAPLGPLIRRCDVRLDDRRGVLADDGAVKEKSPVDFDFDGGDLAETTRRQGITAIVVAVPRAGTFRRLYADAASTSTRQS